MLPDRDGGLKGLNLGWPHAKQTHSLLCIILDSSDMRYFLNKACSLHQVPESDNEQVTRTRLNKPRDRVGVSSQAKERMWVLFHLCSEQLGVGYNI